MCNVHIRTLLKSRSGVYYSKKGWFDEMLITDNRKNGKNGKEWGLFQ
jgi:hypothetical protein